MVAYSRAMLHAPPSTLWQLAACSRAAVARLYRKHRAAYLHAAFKIQTARFYRRGVFAEKSVLFQLSPSALTAFALPTYSGTLRESANSASPRGLER